MEETLETRIPFGIDKHRLFPSFPRVIQRVGYEIVVDGSVPFTIREIGLIKGQARWFY